MTEFIGARISLISNSNIRYVGTLHEINSETSTVALEQVTSHGTEGRRHGENEIDGSENIYEYIVFRGSDVKDLRIEEPAKKVPPPPPPPRLDDPAILGQSSRPFPQAPGPFQQSAPPMGMPPYFYSPPPQRGFGLGPGPYPPGGMFGGYPLPPGGQPPMGLGQPMPGMPLQPPQQPHSIQQASQDSQHLQQSQPAAPQHQPQQQHALASPLNRAPPQAPVGPAANRLAPPGNRQAPQGPSAPTQPTQPQDKSTPVATETKNGPVQQKGPSPSTQTQADGQVPPPNSSTQPTNKAPTGPKARGGIVPALPLTSPARVPVAPANVNNATPVVKNDTSAAVKDLADKVDQLAVSSATAARTNTIDAPAPASGTLGAVAPTRTRQPGTGSFMTGRGRSGYRGGYNAQQNRKVEIPGTDFDFQSNNEKFNKRDLVKEAIASGDQENIPHLVANGDGAEKANADGAADVAIPPAPKDGFYNRQSSFFDNISCENKERAEAVPGERRGGAQFRSEEQKKNLETFGQGSVDGGAYRGGWRGRGRGRGGYRGRGTYAYGNRGGYRTQQAGTASN